MLSREDIVNDRYRLDESIGEGGMGVVWSATDLTLARAVAVKILFAPPEKDRQAAHRQFLREARLAAAVQHRNVVQITDFGTTSDGHAFMVMERLKGETLAEQLSRRGALQVFEAIELGQRVLDGLSAVHRASVVHRDLKPENVFLVDDPDPPYPKILDFGISQSLDPEHSEHHSLPGEHGIVAGTPEYMSPEQFVARDEVGPQSDLYSLGVILYEALTLRCPYASEDRGELVRSIVQGGAPPVREVLEAVPIALSDVIERAMSVDPVDRFFDAREMRDALEVAMQWPNVPLDEALEQVDLEGGEAAGSGAEQVTDAEIFLHDDPPRSSEPPPFVEPKKPKRGALGVVFVAVVAAALGGLAVSLSRTSPELQELATPPSMLAIETPANESASAAEPSEGDVGGERLASGPSSPPIGDEVDASASSDAATDAQAEEVAPALEETLAQEESEAAATDEDAAALEEDEPRPDQADPDRVSLTLVGLPRGARISIDGRRAHRPLSLPRDGERHRVYVTAPGYRGRRYRVAATENVVLQISLESDVDGQATPSPEARPNRPSESRPAESRPAPPPPEPRPVPAPPPRTFRDLDY